MPTFERELIMDRPLSAMRAAVLDFHHMMDAAMPGSTVTRVRGVQGHPGARYRVEARLGNGHPRSPAFELELLEATDTTVKWSSELQGDDGTITFELAPEGPKRTRLGITVIQGKFDSRPELEPVAQAVLEPAFHMMMSSLRKTGMPVSGT